MLYYAYRVQKRIEHNQMFKRLFFKYVVFIDIDLIFFLCRLCYLQLFLQTEYAIINGLGNSKVAVTIVLDFSLFS
jgi:hypothetical protein